MGRSAIARVSEREHWNRFWEESRSAEDVYSNEGRVAARLAEVLSVDGLLVLEVGAGTGRDALDLAAKGARAVTLDYSMPSLRLIRAQLAPGRSVELVCADAFALPFPDGTFDIVFHQGLLEHFRNPDGILAENERVLKRGGVLLVDVPQRYHYYTLVKHLLIALGRWFAGWETEYTVGGLERLLRGHGFTIERSYGEWFNPPIWYRMLRRFLRPAGISLPMYPRIFAAAGRAAGGIGRRLLRTRAALYTTVIIGVIARKE